MNPARLTEDPRTTQIRIALVAPSGSGKSTVAGLLHEAFAARSARVDILKLAAPLYRMQMRYYNEARRPLADGVQDQPLLEQIATTLRRINPNSLVDDFIERLARSTADVVINDDLRDDVTDWPVLHDAGFRVLRVSADVERRRERLVQRNDREARAQSPLDAQIARIPAHEVLVNEGSLDELRVAVRALALRLASAHGWAAPLPGRARDDWA